MNNNAKIKLGIIYILWIIAAWTLVGFYKFTHHPQLSVINPLLSTLGKEAIRFFIFIGPIIIFIVCNRGKPWYRWFGLYGCKKGTIFKTVAIASLYALISSAINIYVFHKSAHVSSISPTFLISTFSLSIIMEEITFRGFLFYLFDKWNKNTIVIVTSLAFAAKHIPGWLFFPMELSPLGFIGDFCMVFLVGGILGYLYLATHSIWSTSIVHSINNLIVALF